MNPLVSIVTVCLNASKTIEETILSVINQTYSNIEFIVKDGGSHDSTLDILSKYKDKITVITEADNGIYQAMNQAKANANGDFLLFLGADDVLYDVSVIERMAVNMKNENNVYYGNVIFSDNGVVFDKKFNKWKWGYENICHQSIFYPKSVYKKYDYDANYKLVADWAYNLNLLSVGIEFVYVDMVITTYNNLSGVSSIRNDNVFLGNRKNLIIDAVGLLPYIYGMVYKSFRYVWRHFFKYKRIN